MQNKHTKQAPPAPSQTSWWRDLLWLTLILGAFNFILLGTRPLFTPDEGRYAEIAREMVKFGDYITPHLDGIKYFEKPILFYWLSAAAIKLGGLSLWALRTVNSLLGLAGCLLTYVTARKLYDRTTGLLAAGILATSCLYFAMDHTISLDLPVTVFIAASLYSFLLATQSTHPKMRRLYCYGSVMSAALAVLTKGLIGVVLPGMIIFLWMAWLWDWRLLKKLPLPSSLYLFLLMTLPWHIIVQTRNPEFFHYYFIEQHFLRYTTAGVGHTEPDWFFIPYLIIGFFPWIIFLPQAIQKTFTHLKPRTTAAKTRFFFFIWAACIFIFFSFSKSKLIPYILPLFPALAILIAESLAPLLTTHQHRQRSIRILFLLQSAFLLTLLALIPHYQTRDIKPLADIIAPLLKPQDDVVAFHQYYQDLPFDLQRRITIVEWRNELQFGAKHQPDHDWLIKDSDFFQAFMSPRRVFAIMGNSEYAKLSQTFPGIVYYKLGQTAQNTLVSNQQ